MNHATPLLCSLAAAPRSPSVHAVHAAIVASAMVALSCAACEPAPLGEGYASPKVTCTSCHGEGDNPAPPRSISGAVDTSDIAVGAHRLHLVDSPIRAAVACKECHVVPKNVDDPGHIDALPAEVTFGPLAKTQDAPALWNRQTMTCATYCHGSTLKGGKSTEPRWTLVDGSQTRCDSCHGFPPPAPHSPITHCALCHAETVDDAGNIKVANGKHIDGVIQAKGDACNGCHGGPNEGGPPPNLRGETATTARGVGAHAAHFDATRHKRIECSTCHIVPQHIEDPGHVDDTDERAEVTFAGLAVHDGKTPSFNRADQGCSNTYCHGGEAKPVWNVVDGTNAKCDACHGFPPAGKHPQRTDCATCHGNVVNADYTFLAPQLHVDGVVETASLPCDACHGGGGQPAPPRDVQGNTATTNPGVGAHASHLASSTWHAPVACSDCHVVPATVDAPGHIDETRPADVTFGARASSRGASPSLYGKGANVGCSNIACHGGAPADAHDTAATNKAPRWTIVDGSEAACGTCHGLPPSAPHPARSDCASCHGAVVDDHGGFVDASKHVNGVVDVACNACHGDQASPAPPKDLAGNVTTTSPGVGAHRAHLGPSSWHRQVACSECHTVPGNVDDPGHNLGNVGSDAEGHALMTFGPLAGSNGVVPHIQDMHCAVYCHGAGDTLTGGSNNSPQWTKVDGTQAACGTCHGLPPPAPHPASTSTSCAGCHPFDGLRPIDPATHVNGTVEVN